MSQGPSNWTPRVIQSDDSRPGVSRGVAIFPDDSRVEFWTGGATMTVLDDFEDGLGAWDRTDNWSQVLTDVHAGTAAAGVDAGSHGSEQYLLAQPGSLPEDFKPGDVICVAFNPLNGGKLDLYFADQDTTPSNHYELGVDVAGGTSGLIDFQKDESSSLTDLYSDSYISGMPDGAYGFLYVYWEPSSISHDPANQGESDASGDLYVEVQDANHVPKASAYIDADDTTYQSGGLGFATGGSHHNHIDDLKHATGPGAFPNFDPTKHVPDAGEIHFFDAADLTYFDDARDSFVVTDEVPTVFGDYCLNFRAGEGFVEMLSAPGRRSSDQKRDLPNYISDGEKGAVYMRTSGVNDEQYFGVASDGTADNYVNVELDYGDRLRVVEWTSGNANVIYENGGISWSANQWYELVTDRSTPGEVAFTLNEYQGSTVDSTGQLTYDSSLQGNDGHLLGGYTPGGGPDFYYDKMEMR